MRALGLDLGSKRIGVAVSDSEGTLALPFDTVHRCGDQGREHRRIAELVAEAEAGVVVVGMPLSLDGSEGPAARRTRREVKALERALPVPIETYDERLTTVSAERSLIDAELGGRRRREVVDKVAAAVMLQSWLDHRRPATHRPHDSPHDPPHDPPHGPAARHEEPG